MRPLNLFLVDDFPVVCRRLLAAISEVRGVTVVGHATGARQALAVIARGRVDLVVLDLFLSEGDGLDVLAGLERVGLSATVLVMTNHGCPLLRDRCKRLGAAAFFDKTLEWQEMIEAIQQARDRLCGP